MAENVSAFNLMRQNLNIPDQNQAQVAQVSASPSTQTAVPQGMEAALQSEMGALSQGDIERITEGVRERKVLEGQKAKEEQNLINTFKKLREIQDKLRGEQGE
jgi:hypothetical protein